MFEFELEHIEELKGAKAGIDMKFKALNLIAEAFIKSTQVYKFEGGLWIF